MANGRGRRKSFRRWLQDAADELSGKEPKKPKEKLIKLGDEWVTEDELDRRAKALQEKLGMNDDDPSTA